MKYLNCRDGFEFQLIWMFSNEVYTFILVSFQKLKQKWRWRCYGQILSREIFPVVLKAVSSPVSPAGIMCYRKCVYLADIIAYIDFISFSKRNRKTVVSLNAPFLL